MNFKRLRGPLAAALSTLMIGGVSVVMAESPAAPTPTPTAGVEEPAGAPETEPEGAPETGGTETGGTETGSDQQDPSYAGKATIPVDESTLPQDEAAEASALAALVTLSQADAEAAALGAVSGEIVKAELDNENGFVVWSIEVRDGSGAIHDVKIDAGNGQVLGTQAGEDGAAE